MINELKAKIQEYESLVTDMKSDTVGLRTALNHKETQLVQLDEVWKQKEDQIINLQGKIMSSEQSSSKLSQQTIDIL